MKNEKNIILYDSFMTKLSGKDLIAMKLIGQKETFVLITVNELSGCSPAWLIFLYG